jgi:hypothetical protein
LNPHLTTSVQITRTAVMVIRQVGIQQILPFKTGYRVNIAASPTGYFFIFSEQK